MLHDIYYHGEITTDVCSLKIIIANTELHLKEKKLSIKFDIIVWNFKKEITNASIMPITYLFCDIEKLHKGQSLEFKTEKQTSNGQSS